MVDEYYSGMSVGSVKFVSEGKLCRIFAGVWLDDVLCGGNVGKCCGCVVARGIYILVAYVEIGRRREEESLLCSRCFEKVGSTDE